LTPPIDMRVRTHSVRTNVVYALLRLPEKLRPSSRSLFLWQDHGFDRWAGRTLERCDFVHGLPGQCLATFRAAKARGAKTVLNHATGPAREWVRIMQPEYERVGLRLEDVCVYDSDYFQREDEEYALADYHCAASSVVRDQLIALGIPAERIWQVPYGADTKVFHPAAGGAAATDFRVLFAGQVCLRKGIRTILEALSLGDRNDETMDFYGAVHGEAQHDLAAYRGKVPLHFHGAISQQQLADAFRSHSVLVLPSLEEGFGLVVPQALNCGLPVIVSDRVGAKDLIRHRENGSIIPVNDAAALRAELDFWAEHPTRVEQKWDWERPARILLDFSEQALR
ncbi:MAG: glycosyltransferase family 4 protein, partial [Chthoniobacteraceae bacterium]